MSGKACLRAAVTCGQQFLRNRFTLARKPTGTWHLCLTQGVYPCLPAHALIEAKNRFAIEVFYRDSLDAFTSVESIRENP